MKGFTAEANLSRNWGSVEVASCIKSSSCPVCETHWQLSCFIDPLGLNCRPFGGARQGDKSSTYVAARKRVFMMENNWTQEYTIQCLYTQYYTRNIWNKNEKLVEYRGFMRIQGKLPKKTQIPLGFLADVDWVELWPQWATVEGFVLMLYTSKIFKIIEKHLLPVLSFDHRITDCSQGRNACSLMSRRSS